MVLRRYYQFLNFKIKMQKEKFKKSYQKNKKRNTIESSLKNIFLISC